MSTQPEALRFADDRPTSTGDDLYQWAVDAEDLIRRQHGEIERMAKERDALGRMMDALQDERDALRAEVERITEAGMAHIRMASQREAERDVLRVTLEARQAQVPAAWAHPDGRVVPAATMSAALRDGGAMRSSLAGYTIPLYAAPQPPAQPVKRLTDEQINALESLEGALEVLVDRCNRDAGMSSDCSVIAVEAALERVYRTRKSSESVEPTTQAATVNRLTDEQIASMWMAGYSDGSGRSMVNLFARAIERAHGIGRAAEEDQPD